MNSRILEVKDQSTVDAFWVLLQPLKREVRLSLLSLLEKSIAEEVNVKYIKADFGVRFFEDAEVNGIQEDEKMPLIPFVNGRR